MSCPDHLPEGHPHNGDTLGVVYYRSAERELAYAAIDSERAYQDAQQGNAKRHVDQPPMTPGEIILCMEKCLADARDAWYRPDGGSVCLPFVRKVAALGVQAMERFGAPRREGY